MAYFSCLYEKIVRVIPFCVNIYLFIEVQETVLFGVRNIHRHYYLVSISMFAVTQLKCGVYLCLPGF